jgi:hypothetical protein
MAGLETVTVRLMDQASFGFVLENPVMQEPRAVSLEY